MSTIRGSRQHNTLFGIEESEELQLEQGRSPEMIADRNTHLLCRYVYYGKDGILDYDYIVKCLSVEFYLKPFTIGKIISGNMGEMKEDTGWMGFEGDAGKVWGEVVASPPAPLPKERGDCAGKVPTCDGKNTLAGEWRCL